jgi:type II secretory pathway component PulC
MIRAMLKLGLIFVLVYSGVYLWYGRVEKSLLAGIGKGEKVSAPEATPVRKGAGTTTPARVENKPLDFSVIVQRNIFQAALEKVEKEPEKPVEKAVPTRLDLVLLGTVVGNDRDARAIIIDNKAKKQDIYQIGDAVQDAFIEEIDRGRVILDVNGAKEELTIKDREGGGAAAPGAAPSKAEPVSWNRKKVKQKVPRVRPHRRISVGRNDSVDRNDSRAENEVMTDREVDNGDEEDSTGAL